MRSQLLEKVWQRNLVGGHRRRSQRDASDLTREKQENNSIPQPHSIPRVHKLGFGSPPIQGL
jgi:hypothetical protein